MSADTTRRIQAHPLFATLVAQRRRWSVVLTLSVMGLFYGLVLLVAFEPAVMAVRLGEGSMLTLGVALIFSLFVLFWLLTALYVRQANTRFDALNRALLDAARDAGR